MYQIKLWQRNLISVWKQQELSQYTQVLFQYQDVLQELQSTMMAAQNSDFFVFLKSDGSLNLIFRLFMLHYF